MLKQFTAEEFRRNTAEISDHLIRSGEPVIIMKNSRPQLVVVDYVRAVELGLAPPATELDAKSA